MLIPLNILIVEDSEDDALLLVDSLRLAGYDPKWKRVDTEAECRANLGKHLDVVFSDFTLPRFSTPRALEILKESKLDIPFIIVSGTIGEERAVETLKAGATDYVLKDRIKRVGPVVKRAILEARERGERKRAEEELRQKTAMLEAQVDSSLDGILVVDDKGKKILQNQRLNDIFNIPHNVADNPDDAVQIQFVTSRVKNPAQFTERVFYLYSHPDETGSDEIELKDGIILDRYSSPVRDRNGKHYGRIWAFRDITERRKLEEQFRQSQKMEAIGQLAGGVAHDFNNILAVIQMQVGLVEALGSLLPMQLDYCREIVKAVQRAANLTRQLLMFSRKQALQPKDLNLNDVVSNISKMLHRVLGEDMNLHFRYSKEQLFIHADAGMMEQILLNLTVNSRDAMPKGGQISIEIAASEFDEITAAQVPQARAGSFVCLSVNDTGSGIPKEILPHIFEPFFTTKDVGKGTGLGLATVFGIVQQHQGWINVYSEIGQGTTIRVYLPRLIKADGIKFPEPPTVSSQGGNETILLVEDDSSLCALIQRVLTRLGYRVYEASTSFNALEIWKTHRNEIHLLLTDLVLPDGMNGIELARQLLQDRPELKVIYASGYSADVAGRDFHLEGGANFLSKPFEAHKLAQIIRVQLDSIVHSPTQSRLL